MKTTRHLLLTVSSLALCALALSGCADAEPHAFDGGEEETHANHANQNNGSTSPAMETTPGEDVLEDEAVVGELGGEVTVERDDAGRRHGNVGLPGEEALGQARIGIVETDTHTQKVGSSGQAGNQLNQDIGQYTFRSGTIDLVSRSRDS